MNFTYDSYKQLLDTINKNYKVVDYHTYRDTAFSCILRHDIDESPTLALRIAEIEADHAIKATYFFLLNTDFYNVASSRVIQIIKKISLLGHNIGLHFDETQYNDCAEDDRLKAHVYSEVAILSKLVEQNITTVSMHRPSKRTFESNYVFDGLVNSYSKEFILDFKYLSDSRMHWREDVMRLVKTKEHNAIHILTHPIWYTETGRTAHDILLDFVNCGTRERYKSLKENIRDLDEIIKESEIVY